MTIIKYISAIIWVALSFVSIEAAELNREFLTIYTEELYPESYKLEHDESETVVGYSSALVRAVVEGAGFDYRIEIVPWARAIQSIDSTENVLVYSMARTPQREQNYLWIGETLPLRFYLYGLKSKLELLPKTLSDAINSRVGVVRGDVVENYLTSTDFNNLIRLRNPTQSLAMLYGDRLDLIPFTRRGFGSYVAMLNFNPDDFIGVVEIEGVARGQYMVLSKSTDQSVFDRLQSSYARIVDSGDYADIMGPMLAADGEISVEVLE